MIRSSDVSLKFSNTGKLNYVSEFVDEYKSVVSFFVETLWNEEKIPFLLPKEITSKVTTWLSARAIQCAGKQASGIVRGTKQKQKQRLWKINDFNSKGMFKKARNLQEIYEKINVSKPFLNNVQPELDERFVKINLENSTSFDGYITLSSLGKKLSLKIPFKKTKHFNYQLTKGTLKKGIRLSKRSATFMFELPDFSRIKGEIVGIDIGVKTCLSVSNPTVSFSSKQDIHGWDLDTINERLAHRKKGSKNFLKTQEHRDNYINWTINDMLEEIPGIKKIKIENIRGLRKGVRTSRKLQHFSYADIFSSLENKLTPLGVQVEKVNPTYTSQRCSKCGWTRKSNRKGKLFTCKSCGHTQDADMNASFNIWLDLPPIRKEERLKNKNREGFFWLPISSNKEPIVPSVQKTLMG